MIDRRTFLRIFGLAFVSAAFRSRTNSTMQQNGVQALVLTWTDAGGQVNSRVIRESPE
ncbi:MAG TPA: hypothetical protein V6C65_07265 [Allocoleopsis sp.]